MSSNFRCAFKNTPKYNQVCGHGKIVARTWIGKCHSSKKRIPWRRHALDSDEEIKTDSEEEIFDEKLRPSATDEHSSQSIELIDSPIKQTNDSPQSKPSTSSSSLLGQKSKPRSNYSESSDIDTEDEIERITQKQKQATKDSEKQTINKSPVKQTTSNNNDIYDKTTEEDERKIDQNNDSKSISPLPEFFEMKTFYLCDNLSSIDIIKLRRFITVYKGEIIDRSDTADYVITNQLLSTVNNKIHGEIVKPLWVFECNDMECLLPTKRYKF